MAGTGTVVKRRVRVAPTIGSSATGGRILASVLPLVVVIYMFLLFPVETRPSVLGVNLPIYRLGILLFTPFMLSRLTAPHSRFIFPDWLIVMATIWILISFCGIYGFGNGLVRGSGVVIDFAGAYALARLAIDGPTAFRRFLIMISPGLFLAGMEMVLESVTGHLIVRPLFASIFGQVNAYEGGEISGTLAYGQETRLGLLRAFGPFSHPILGGAVLTSSIPLWFKSHLRSWPKIIGMISAFAGLASLSSAAFLGVALGVVLLATDWGKNFIDRLSWPVIAVFGALLLTALELVSNSGLIGLISRMTFDPQTAAYRQAIWQWGTFNVANHPWIGLGYYPWIRPNWMTLSVDNHFLVLAMRNGLPVPLLLMLCIGYSVFTIGSNVRHHDGASRDILVGVNMTMFILLLVSATVNYYGETNVWFMVIVGITASLSAFSTSRAPGQSNLATS